MFVNAIRSGLWYRRSRQQADARGARAAARWSLRPVEYTRALSVFLMPLDASHGRINRANARDTHDER